MNKVDIITKIRNAKVSHLTWKSYAHLIAEGTLTDPKMEHAPLVSTQCGFGKWYYGDGAVLSRLKSYKDIESPHNELHVLYSKIYAFRKNKTERGFLVNAKKAERIKGEQIKTMLTSLDKIVELMLLSLTKLERDVSSLSDEQVKSLY